jgi:hypothetical protein
MGITEYIRAEEGMGGIVKQRFSDFQVSEVDEEGRLVVLTETSVPQAPPTPVEELAAASQHADDVARPELRALLGEETVAQIAALDAAGQGGQPVIVDVGDDKARRKRVHQLIRECFDHVASRTLQTDASEGLSRDTCGVLRDAQLSHVNRASVAFPH